MLILLTGGAGYIGSHTALELLLSGHDIIVFDNLCNSSKESLSRVEALAGKSLLFVEGDLRDNKKLDSLFSKFSIDAVIHFAGLKAVGESVENPLEYYDSNVAGSINLFRAMAAANVFKLVFSSSATVYGVPEHMPITENFPVGTPASPYGRSKLIVEQILQDLVFSDSRWGVAILRYFNPVGAHPSGLIGEDPNGKPNNLLPYISRVVQGKLSTLCIYGDDYPTRDGTGVRDYIHVVDLAKGHLAALDFVNRIPGLNVWNLGAGKGYSVLEVVSAFEVASNRKLACRVSARRPGDIAECWSDPSKAGRELGWFAKLTLEDIMNDTWNWLTKNPDGYNK